MQMMKYEAACRAVAEALTLDEVKEITNIAEAARAYARQAKNRQMEIDAIEIRVRAERRLGEILLKIREEKTFQNGRPRLSDLGLDGTVSGAAQRLAKLPVERFELEIEEWRNAAPTATVLKVPLQYYRKPSISADQEKQRFRRNPNHVDARDPFDKFRAPDGRKVSDWRVGELKRIDELARRTIRCVNELRERLPVANADPLSTMEAVFPRDVLLNILDQIWDDPIDCGDAGINQARIDLTRKERTRTCRSCGASFVMKRVPHADRPTEGQFCSRKCSHEQRADALDEFPQELLLMLIELIAKQIGVGVVFRATDVDMIFRESHHLFDALEAVEFDAVRKSLTTIGNLLKQMAGSQFGEYRIDAHWSRTRHRSNSYSLVSENSGDCARGTADIEIRPGR